MRCTAQLRVKALLALTCVLMTTAFFRHKSLPLLTAPFNVWLSSISVLSAGLLLRSSIMWSPSGPAWPTTDTLAAVSQELCTERKGGSTHQRHVTAHISVRQPQTAVNASGAWQACSIQSKPRTGATLPPCAPVAQLRIVSNGVDSQADVNAALGAAGCPHVRLAVAHTALSHDPLLQQR